MDTMTRSGAGGLPSSTLTRLVALLVFAATLLAYLATMPRAITFEDAGLFNGVCATAGIAHPPGYPLFTLICTPLYWLPLDPVLLGNGLSAVFAALACALTSAILRQLGTGGTAAAFGGLLLGFSNAFWSQAIIVEVYSLNALIFLGILLVSIRFAQTPAKRDAFLLAFLVGLGFANHWPLITLALPGLAILWSLQIRWIGERLREPAFWTGVLGCTLAGLSPYLYLFLRQDPVVSYSGSIDSLAEFVSYVLRESYAGQDQQAAADILDKLSFITWVLQQSTQQFSILAFVLVPLAIGFALRGSLTRINIAMAVIFLCQTVLLAALLGFDFQFASVNVFRPYPLIAWTCLALWAAIGLDWAINRIPGTANRTGRFLVILLAAAGILSTLASGLERNDRADDWIAEAFSKLVLDSLPPEAVLVVRADAPTFTLLYQHLVQGRRPDITLYQIDNIGVPTRLPGNSRDARERAVMKMAREHTVFSLGVPTLPLEIDYGIYMEHDGTGVHRVARNEEHAAFRRRLVEALAAEEIPNPYARVFAEQLLLGVANQLTSIGLLQSLNEGEARDLATLQQTVPGVLVTLYTAITRPEFDISARQLLTRAFALEENMPPPTTNVNRAHFYYYFAQLYLTGTRGIQPDETLALALLLKGFNVWPVPENPVVCTLVRSTPPPGHAVTQQHFRAPCESGPSIRGPEAPPADRSQMPR